MRSTPQKTDRRMTFTANLRAEAEGESRTVTGHAAIWDTLSEPLGGFREKIEKGAFTRAIKEDDVRALWNHDPSLIMARSKAGEGTLKLSEDSTGLRSEWEMPEGPQGDWWLDAIRRGDVNQMSFNFIPKVVEWEHIDGEDSIATVREAELFDVSPVTYPAYLETDIQARNLKRSLRDDGGAAVADPEVETDEDQDDDELTDDELAAAEVEAQEAADQDLATELEIELEEALAEVDRITAEIEADADPDNEIELDEDDEEVDDQAAD